MRFPVVPFAVTDDMLPAAVPLNLLIPEHMVPEPCREQGHSWAAVAEPTRREVDVYHGGVKVGSFPLDRLWHPDQENRADPWDGSRLAQSLGDLMASCPLEGC